MRRINTAVALLALGALTALGQSYGLAPYFSPQFFDNNGRPLTGGKLHTCNSGSSCPGSPLATYTDSTGFQANANPILLNASGRPSNGGSPVGIWLDVTKSYKLVLTTSADVVIQTVDNVIGSAGGSGGGGSTNYWTLSGSDISNNNGSGAGNVSVGAGFTVGGNITVNGSLRLKDTQVSPHYAIIRAANVVPSDYTWRWPGTDAAGCLVSDGLGALSFSTTCGGGSGGTPGGNNTQVQFNNSGAFGGSSNMTWNNAGQLLTVTATGSGAAGIAVGTGYVQADAGFYATVGTATNYNAIQAPGGGMAALSFTAVNYAQVGNSNGVPTATTGDTFNPGAIYCDTPAPGVTPCVLQLNDGTGWVAIAAGGATSPGGANTNVQFNSGGAFAGSANFTFASQLLTVTAASSVSAGMAVATGFMQADQGFLATSGIANNFNVIQAPTGGLYGKSLTAQKYIQAGNNASGPPSTTTGDTFNAGALYWDLAAGCLEAYNGATWNCLSSGGGGTPGGATTQVQYNNSGTFAGSANFTWNNGSRLLTISAAASSVGLVVSNGYIQADTGFLATSGTATGYNAIQAPGGGLAARSVTAVRYVQTGNSAGVPAVTSGDSFNAGAMFWNTSTGTEQVFNGSTWVSLATGGIPSLNSLTGALNLVCAAPSSCSISSIGTTITITSAQPLATTSNVTFGTVFSTGAISTGGVITTSSGVNVTSTSATNSIQTTGGVLSAVGLATTSTATNSIQTAGGLNLGNTGSSNGVLQINGSTVLDANGVFSGRLNMALSGNSVIWTGTAGNFYTRAVAGPSTGITACGTTADGWLSVTNDNYIVVCLGGARFRAALVAF